MCQLRTQVISKGFPYFVAVLATADKMSVVGYAYASPYRPRPAYRFTVENSVYIHPQYAGRGVGVLLMTRIIDDCTAKGFRQMLAYTSKGSDTVALHEKLGFKQVGVYQSLGWKFSRWLDVCVLQRALGEGDDTPPAQDTLAKKLHSRL